MTRAEMTDRLIVDIMTRPPLPKTLSEWTLREVFWTLTDDGIEREYNLRFAADGSKKCMCSLEVLTTQGCECGGVNVAR